eukprot:NODE_177_length_14091_cov_0.996141.p11 type:complete len:109 gc:universal NODE_177_length_14091_cov_0.996141:12565-12891(+)
MTRGVRPNIIRLFGHVFGEFTLKRLTIPSISMKATTNLFSSGREQVDMMLNIPNQPTMVTYNNELKSIQHPLVYLIFDPLLKEKYARKTKKVERNEKRKGSISSLLNE